MTRPTVTWGSLALSDWRVVTAGGDLDLATAPVLGQQMCSAVPASATATHLIVDMAGVTFLDCSGLGALVAARNRLGDRFLLLNPSHPVCRLLRLTGLSDAFTVISEPSPAQGLRPVYASLTSARTGPTQALRPVGPVRPVRPVGTVRALEVLPDDPA